MIQRIIQIGDKRYLRRGNVALRRAARRRVLGRSPRCSS
jgi:hypothetical protein